MTGAGVRVVNPVSLEVTSSVVVVDWPVIVSVVDTISFSVWVVIFGIGVTKRNDVVEAVAVVNL